MEWSVSMAEEAIGTLFKEHWQKSYYETNNEAHGGEDRVCCESGRKRGGGNFRRRGLDIGKYIECGE